MRPAATRGRCWSCLPSIRHHRAAGDALRTVVAEALFAIPAWVERCEPVQIQAEDGGASVPALQYTITE